MATAYRGLVRDIDTIDQELRLVAAIRAMSEGPPPSIIVADQLLDERLLMRTAPSSTRS